MSVTFADSAEGVAGRGGRAQDEGHRPDGDGQWVCASLIAPFSRSKARRSAKQVDQLGEEVLHEQVRDDP